MLCHGLAREFSKRGEFGNQGLFRMLGLLAHFIACISPAKTVFAVGSDL